MCVEAAVCAALGLPHNDDPGCVTESVRTFKIRFNDSSGWASPASRAYHLRALGIAQLGSKDVVSSREFVIRLAKTIIQHVLPRVCREVCPGQFKPWVDACEQEGTEIAAKALVLAFDTTAGLQGPGHVFKAAGTTSPRSVRNVVARAVETAMWATTKASRATETTATETAAFLAAETIELATYAIEEAKGRQADPEIYLRLVATLVLDILRDLKSPGVAWIS